MNIEIVLSQKIKRRVNMIIKKEYTTVIYEIHQTIYCDIIWTIYSDTGTCTYTYRICIYIHVHVVSANSPMMTTKVSQIYYPNDYAYTCTLQM